jgi:uncharacterized membrane protein YheB (UPF0754 family)
MFGRRVPIGKLAVLSAFVMAIVCWVAMTRYPWAEVLRDVFIAGFVGGFTNTVAIRMLFDKVWYLPGSGVLLDEREAIIATLADTVEAHILNPSLIESRVHELSAELDRARIAAAINAVLEEVRPDIVAFVRAKPQRDYIVDALKQESGFWGSMADSLGLMTYDVVADRLIAGITSQIEHLTVDETMVDTVMDKVGSLDDFVLRPQNRLVQRHYGSDLSLAQLLFDKLDAKQLVIDKLSMYDATQIRDIIADNIQDHLGWLEVFGVIIGMGIAALAQVITLLLK